MSVKKGRHYSRLFVNVCNNDKGKRKKKNFLTKVCHTVFKV